MTIRIRRDSPGPGFYKQIRVGRNGRGFLLYKFRSMKVGSDKTVLLTVGEKDPRITKSGSFIRRSKLDEFPQLINVLLGEMSIVGPRPEVPKYVALYNDEQRKVLNVRPGISDWSSIRFSNENELLAQAENSEEFYISEIMPEKLRMNLEYIRTNNFFMETFINISALLLCNLLFAQNIKASEFKVVKKQGDTVLYKRWITGTKGVPARELKAEFSVKSNSENVIDLLKNQQEGTKWNMNTSIYKIANTRNQDVWVNYIKYDMPGFMDDQEGCLLFQVVPISGQQNVVVSFESTLSPIFPVNPDVKRITGIRGQRILQRQSDPSLKVTYLISSDNSSNIPRFISDPIIRGNLFKTIESFKDLLEK